MERRGSNNWLVAVLAVAVGFLAALLIFGGGNDKSSNSAATASGAAGTDATGAAGVTGGTTATPQAAPAPSATSTASCIALWNQPMNRGAQTLLVNVMSQEPVRINVGTAPTSPPQCMVTIVGNRGDAYPYTAGGNGVPYAPAPGKTDSSSLPAAQKISNALEQRDGTLTER